MSQEHIDHVLAYYDAINQKQPALAISKLAADIELTTPLATRTGTADVLEAIKGLCSVVEKIDIDLIMAKGEQVMLTYNIEFPGIGNLRAAGLVSLNQGLITRIELFYDPSLVETKKDAIFSES